jgi:hypothetical protein
MRLQRIGHYILYYDPNQQPSTSSSSSSIFYYNQYTRQGSFTKPSFILQYEAALQNKGKFPNEEFLLPSSSSHGSSTFSLLLMQPNQPSQQQHSKKHGLTSSTSSINHPPKLPTKMSMRIKKCGQDWIQYMTEENQEFYYNQKTSEFSWENPFQSTALVDSTTPVEGNIQSREAHNHSFLYKHTDWRPFVDEASGYVFWYNQVTQVSQWENPFEHTNQSINGNIPPLHDDIEEDVVPVLHDNDLGL